MSRQKDTTNVRGIPIYSGKNIRCIVYGHIARKSVYGTKHQVQKPHGWAIDVEVLEEAERLGATVIEVFDNEDNRTYTAPIAKFREKGVQFDRGYGLQIVLPLGYFDCFPPRAEATSPKLQARDTAKDVPVGEQLSLLGDQS